MTISNEYKEKSIALQKILQNDQLSDNEKGKELCLLYRKWTCSRVNCKKLIPVADYIYRLENVLFTEDNSKYDEFYRIVSNISNVGGINNFLTILNDFVVKNNNIVNDRGFSLRDKGLTPYAVSQQVTSFFLFLNNLETGFPITDQKIIKNLFDISLNGTMLNEQIYINICEHARNHAFSLGCNSNLELLDKIHNDSLKNNNQLNSLETNIAKNTIFYGPPGTGKTFSVVDYAYAIINKCELDKSSLNRKKRQKIFEEKIQSEISFITFHQSYSYEEFVEGITAKTDTNGNISYKNKNGIFKNICMKAKDNKDKNYVLIIDEINRGNISKIFGELITLIEESKREGQNEALTVTLPYSNDFFSVPNNLYIIGTMNTADRSLALIDTALRRRFEFVEIMPDITLLGNILIADTDINIQKMLETINQRIEVLYDREHTLGHAFFMSLIENPKIEILAGIFKNKIIPLLQEYFFEDWEKIRMVLGDDRKTSNDPKFIVKKEFFDNLFKDNNILDNLIRYEVCNDEQDDVFLNPRAYIGIYE